MSVKEEEKKIPICYGSVITGVLIRAMSCIITIVFDNTTAGYLGAISELLTMLLMDVNKIQENPGRASPLHGLLVKAL